MPGSPSLHRCRKDTNEMTALWWLIMAAVTAAPLLLGISADAEEIEWRDGTTLTLEGKGWPNTAEPYDRLPDAARSRINNTAWEQSKESAGLCIRFVTNASKIRTRWSLNSESLAMPHMPATGVSGLDLYVRDASGAWRFMGNGRPHKQHDNESTFTLPSGDGLTECLLYLPLYNKLARLSVGVPSGARLEPAAERPLRKRRPVVFYGTSITQGGCASRPGMAYPAILGRWLDRPSINLGFSSGGIMETSVGGILAELDPEVYVIDCLWNIGNTSQDEFDARVGALVRAIRAVHRKTPIIFVGQSLIEHGAHPTEMTRKQEAAVRKLTAQGVPHLHSIPGDELVGDDGEATVDGVHLTDLGMLRQARVLLPVLKRLVR